VNQPGISSTVSLTTSIDLVLSLTIITCRILLISLQWMRSSVGLKRSKL
jgi:hypothetical protein